jgi:hypothetical protein
MPALQFLHATCPVWFTYLPTTHAEHASAFGAPDEKRPAAQVTHVRSEIVVGAALSYLPAAQIVHEAHDICPVDGWKRPPWHSLHDICPVDGW